MSQGDSVHFGAVSTRRLGEVLKRLLKSKRFYQRRKYGALVGAWQCTAGEEIAAHCRIAAFEHGRLLVEVDEPILLHELAGFMRSTVLSELQGTPGGEDVAELRFRLGPSRAE